MPVISISKHIKVGSSMLIAHSVLPCTMLQCSKKKKKFAETSCKPSSKSSESFGLKLSIHTAGW